MLPARATVAHVGRYPHAWTFEMVYIAHGFHNPPPHTLTPPTHPCLPSLPLSLSPCGVEVCDLGRVGCPCTHTRRGPGPHTGERRTRTPLLLSRRPRSLAAPEARPCLGEWLALYSSGHEGGEPEGREPSGLAVQADGEGGLLLHPPRPHGPPPPRAPPQGHACPCPPPRHW